MINNEESIQYSLLPSSLFLRTVVEGSVTKNSRTLPFWNTGSTNGSIVSISSCCLLLMAACLAATFEAGVDTF